jgi:CBS domain-containing protein
MPYTAERSYVGPAFEDAKVYDAMNLGVVTCRRETGLDDVARMMSGYDMHAIVVSDVADHGRAWGIVTSLDLARAGDDIRRLTAGDVAVTDVLTVDSNVPLTQAARTMAEHRVSHLVVVGPGTDHPVGMISASGVTAAIGYGSI